MSEIDYSLLNDFIVEASEHLDEMETQLLELKPGEKNEDLCNDIFRPIHTIKGAAQFVGLDQVSKLTHRLEDLLVLLRDGQIETTNDIVDTLIEGRDRIAQLVKDLETSESENTEVDDLVDKVKYLLDHQGIFSTDEPAIKSESKPQHTGDSDSFDSDGAEINMDDLSDEDTDALMAEAAAAEKVSGDSMQEEILQAFPEDRAENADDEQMASSAPSTAGIMLLSDDLNEDYDQELHEIFLQQLRDKAGLVGTLARALEGGADDRDVMQECIEHVEQLRSAANYMGYDTLIVFYDEWREKMQSSMRLLEVGQSYPPAYMVSSVNTLVGSIPGLASEELMISAETSADPEVVAEFDLVSCADDDENLELDSSEVNDFVEQALDHLKDMEQGLLQFEQDPENQTHLEEVFRAAQAIKGVAQFVGLVRISEISHRMEDLLAQIRQGDKSASPQILTILLTAKDRLKRLTEDLAQNGTEETSIDDVVETLDHAIQASDNLEDIIAGESSASRSEMDEPNDKELYQIFIGQLGELIGTIQREVGHFSTTPSAGLLLEIEQKVRHLRHSAAYMGYEDLKQNYQAWLEELEQARLVMSEGATPDLGFAASRIQVIQQMFTELEIDPSASTPKPEIAESEAQMGHEDVAQETPTAPEDLATDESELFIKLALAMEVPADQQNKEFETLHSVFDEMLGQPETEPDKAAQTVQAKPAAALTPDVSSPSVQKTTTFQQEEASKQPLTQTTQVPVATSKPEDQKEKSPEKPIVESSGKDARDSRKGRAFKTSVRVDAEKIDSLMNQVGELVVNRSYFFMLHNEMHDLQNHLKNDLGIDPRDLKQVRLFNYRLGEAIASLNRTSNDLQEGIMKVRMLPISQIFNRYPRLIHDLTNHTNKRVNLEIHGEETELDKMIVEELSDPLIHIIRNAVDHGFEPVDERKRAGKPEEGTLIVEAYQESNHIVIEVRDDGRGIDVNRIKAKALEKKLLSKDELDRMSQRDLMRLIMRAGFSTADKVTRTSGRGVGMDVAKKNIEKMNGTLEIDSQLGIGTSIRLKIPLTLAIIPALLVRVGKNSFTIPLSNVEETLRIFETEISTIEGTEVVHLRGHTMPIFRLSTLFNMDEDENAGERSFVVVVNAGAEKIGLVVDELMGQEEVVIKPLVDYLQERSGFSGATIMGDGRISLILDVCELVNMTSSAQISKIRKRDTQRRFLAKSTEKQQEEKATLP